MTRILRNIWGLWNDKEAEMTNLTTTQKECLSQCRAKGLVRIGDGGGPYPKQTIHKLIKAGFLTTTEYFNQYILTDSGQKKILKFRKDYTPECTQ